MSWSENIYSFLQTTQVSPGFFFTFDVLIQEANPGLIFNGSESNAVFAVVREIAGDLWVAQNADWNGTNWIPKNLSIPTTFFVFRGPASVSFPSYLQKYVIAAGVTPAVPGTANIVMQLTNTGQFTVAGVQKGTATGMLADGSTNTLTYSSFGGVAFANATDQIFLTVVINDTITGFLSPKVLTKTPSGVTFQLPGGQNGQTVSIDFIAYGH